MTRTEILEKHAPRMENVLLILHALQNRNPRNYLPAKDLALVAGYLNTTAASIYGIASYYTMFSLSPRGRHIIRICRSPVCRMDEADELFTALKRILDIDIGQTTPDALFTLETTECLGQCDQAPVMTVDESIYGNLTPSRIETIIRNYRGKRHRARRSKR
jgi:NADH-quinone oxidoreductase subunit E